MTVKLIELVDHNLCVRDADGVLARSPGFCSIANKDPLFGEAARQLARLQPRHTFNQFWSQLSLDPLPLKTPLFRHHADMAYGHLRELTQGLDLEDGVVLGVPSNYSRTQLAVLLGVVKQSNFAQLGLVDLALLQALATPADECIVIELQLHQAVLTRLRRSDGHLVKDTMAQVPAAGMIALQDAYTNVITDEFLRQSRFDPKHNAETEQYLYNQLDSWIAQARDNPEVLIDINHKGLTFQARLTLEHFIKRGSNVFARIERELQQLRTPETALHIRTSQLQLPGLTTVLGGVIAVDDAQLMTHCLAQLDNIKSPPEAPRFVTRLPLTQDNPEQATTARGLPTHVVWEYKAIPLPLGRLGFGSQLGDLPLARLVPVDDLPGALVIERQSRNIVLELKTTAPVSRNGQPVTSGTPLQLGDTLLVGEARRPLQLIQVEQG